MSDCIFCKIIKGEILGKKIYEDDEILALIFIALLIRMCGVFVCVIKTPLTMRERLFCSAAYLPKATVQAAIGSIPLTQGVSAGSIILTVAVIAILITAPLGGFIIDASYKGLLGSHAPFD